MSNSEKDPFEKRPAKRLPKTLAGWITTAVRDAQELSQDKHFKLNMSVFNDFQGFKLKCHVCLAGACLVNRGLIAPGSDFNGHNNTIAFSLDDIRGGFVEEAANRLFRKRLIAWKPTKAAIQRASDLIFNNCKASLDGGRAPWDVYLEAARIVSHKPKKADVHQG